MMTLESKILSAIQSVLPNNKEFIPLHEPFFKGNEWNYVKECIDTSWVSSVGKYVDRFEKDLAEFTGVKRAVAVVNGTAALHIALKIVGVQENDEVLIPTLTFIATANAVAYCNAIPHFIESEEATLGIDTAKLDAYLAEITTVNVDGCFNKNTGRRIKAIVPMHTFGHPVNLDSLLELCERYKLELVEDAAESLGSYYKGKHTGSFGKISAVSFNGNKIITTGGGGAILTNDDNLADLAKHLTTTAKKPHKWEYEHDHIGYNYRLPNINAALGCAQLENLPEYISTKRKLAEQYKVAFDQIGEDEVRFFTEPKDCKSNYWLNTLILQEDNVERRDVLLESLNNAGIMSRPLWKPMHKLEMYKNCPKMDLGTAESLERRIINIPSSVTLGGV